MSLVSISGSRGVFAAVLWFSVQIMTFGGLVPAGINFCPAVFASENQQEAEKMVQEGIELYRNDQLDEARKILKKAESIQPKNLAVPYYLGMIHLKAGDRDKAVFYWKRYVALSPENKNALTIRKYITLLLRKIAAAQARQAIADEAALSDRLMEENAVAVTAFRNIGSKALAPLGKAMAAMIISDLAQFKDLKIVERERLNALLREVELGRSGIVDEKSATRVGYLLKAKYIAGGSLADPQKDYLKIASALFDAGENTVKANQDSEGKLQKFYQLEKEIACKIATDLGRDCRTAPDAFHKVHTESMPAFTAYAVGLDYMDREKYDEAGRKFQEAVKEDPGFDLARAALLATPAAAMLVMTELEILSSASAGAPAAGATAAGAGATATGAATTGTTATGAASAGATAAGASAGASGLGLGTTAAIAGGVAAGGAAAAIGFAEQGEDDSPSRGSLQGQWRATWISPDGHNDALVMNLTQNGGSIGGTVVGSETQCLPGGDISGSIDQTRVRLDISSASAAAVLDVEIISGDKMFGGIEFISGDCAAGEPMEINVNRVGDAQINW